MGKRSNQAGGAGLGVIAAVLIGSTVGGDSYWCNPVVILALVMGVTALLWPVAPPLVTKYRKRRDEKRAQEKRDETNLKRAVELVHGELTDALRLLNVEIDSRRLNGWGFMPGDFYKAKKDLLAAHLSQPTTDLLVKAFDALNDYNEKRKPKHEAPTDAEYQDPDAAWRNLDDGEIDERRGAKQAVEDARGALAEEWSQR